MATALGKRCISRLIHIIRIAERLAWESMDTDTRASVTTVGKHWTTSFISLIQVIAQLLVE